MEKWDDRKDLVFPHVCLVGEKNGEDGKCNLYKLTIMSLLYNI